MAGPLKFGACVWLSILTLASCASYEPTSAVVPTWPEMNQSVSVGGLHLAAAPITDDEIQEAVFDADFEEAGVLAIQVLARNEEAKPYLIRSSDIALTTSGGQRFRVAGIASTVDKLGEDGSVVGASLAFGIIGFLVAADAEDSARASRTADYRSKAFVQRTLRHGEEASGNLFFIPPDNTPAFNEGVLSVRFIDAAAGTSLTLELPLTGLGFEPVVEKSTSQGR